MGSYCVRISDRAFYDLDSIYEYIAGTLREPSVALSLVDEIESAILSLEDMPYRCPERKIGIYANRGYRQLFIKNYTAVFRINEQTKTVVVVAIRYSPSEF